MLTQPPDVSFVACQACTVDAALLSGTNADGLTVLDVANGVGLGVFQGNQGDDEVALSLWCEGLVLCGDVLKQGRVIQLDFITTLFKGYAEALLTLNGLGFVCRINLDDIIGTLTLVLEYLDGFSCEVGSNDTITYLTLQQKGCRSIAGVG